MAPYLSLFPCQFVHRDTIANKAYHSHCIAHFLLHGFLQLVPMSRFPACWQCTCPITGHIVTCVHCGTHGQYQDTCHVGTLAPVRMPVAVYTANVTARLCRHTVYLRVSVCAQQVDPCLLFTIDVPGRTYPLCADSSASVTQWVTALNETLGLEERYMCVFMCTGVGVDVCHTCRTQVCVCVCECVQVPYCDCACH